MIELEEEIEFTRDLFQVGKATFKYRGNLDKYNSEKSGINHFSHEHYYQIHIKDIQPLQEDQYHWKPKLLELKNFDKNIIGQLADDADNDKYQLDIDRLFIIEPIKLAHSQNEGDEIHGFVEDITVVFKMHRQETGLVCKKDIKTGLEEIRDGILHYEITTGERCADGTCETVWIPELAPPPPSDKACPKDEPTGNREDKENCHRLEFYSGIRNSQSGQCETYWGEWNCKECEQDKWTGRERTIAGWVQREYYNKDCSTYWKNFEKVKGCLEGCSDIFTWIPILLLTLIPIWLSVKYGSFMPILLGIGIPLLLASFGFILNFLGRFPNGVNRFLRLLMNLVILFVLVSILNGIFSLFDSRNWGGGRSSESWEDNNYEVEHIDYDNEMNVEDEEDRPDLLKVKLRWRDFAKNRYTGTYYLNKDEIKQSAASLHTLESYNYSRYQPVYSQVFQNDKNKLNSMYHMLDSIKLSKKLDTKDFANVITTMVQSIEYVLILDRGCNDPMVLQNNDVRKMLQSGIECAGNAPYGIKTPLEFLSSMKGDCDTRTLLLYTIFKHYKYDVAIINSEFYGHSMLGLSIPGARGVYKQYKGKKYYFWETTNTGYRLGELEREMGNLNFWNVELN